MGLTLQDTWRAGIAVDPKSFGKEINFFKLWLACRDFPGIHAGCLCSPQLATSSAIRRPNCNFFSLIAHSDDSKNCNFSGTASISSGFSEDFRSEVLSGKSYSDCNSEDVLRLGADAFENFSLQPAVIGEESAAGEVDDLLLGGFQLEALAETLRREGKAEPLDNSEDLGRKNPFLDQAMFLELIGVDVVRVIQECPMVLSRSCQELKTTVKFLEARGVPGHLICKVLNHTPEIFMKDTQSELLPTVSYIMQRMGVRKIYLGKMLYRCPPILLQTVEDLRLQHQFFDSVGFSVDKAVKNNPGLLCYSIKDKLIPQMDYFMGIGIHRDDVRKMFRRFPALFVYSLESNISPKLEYLVQVMNRAVDELVVYPQYFGCSLECRIKKRFEHLQIRGKARIGLMSMLSISDDMFYELYK